MRTWSYELQEKSMKFLIELSMGLHSCDYIYLCHTSGKKGYIQTLNAFNHSWVIEINEEQNSQLCFNSALEIIKNGWIVEEV